MVHEMKLNDRAIDNISIGIKKFELRLFDEKRAKINLNDYIIFKSLSESSRTLKVKEADIQPASKYTLFLFENNKKN